nr:hypothetical protein [Tanacetum cinerariifolium]
MALPDKHQLMFNIHKDAKSLMEAIKKRLQKLISQLGILGESISQEDINMKFLRSLPSEWKTPTLIWRNKVNLEEQSLDESVNVVPSVSAASTKASVSTLPNVDSLSDAVIYSFFARGFFKGLEGIYVLIEKLLFDLTCPRLNVTIVIEGSIFPGNADHQGTAGIKTLHEELFQWRFILSMLWCSSSSLGSDNEVAPCSKACSKAYATLQSHYDKLTVDLKKSQINILSYKIGLESVEARLVVYQQNENMFEEDIKLLKLDVMLRDNALVELRKKFKKAKKERNELKLTLDKFQTSSKILSKLLESQICDKTGLGYDSQVFNRQVFDCDELNSYELDDSIPTSPMNDKYQSGEGYHVVPPPYTRTFMPPKPDLVFNDAPPASKIVPNVVNVKSSTNKPSKEMSKTLRPDAPIIEDWTSDSEDESKPESSVKIVEHPQQSKNLRTYNPKSKDFKEFNRGYVAFGRNPKGGKISGKDTECVILSFDFKLPDDNHVLLRVSRENNMYNVDLKNVVPLEDLTCLFAKATLNESNLWHRRLGHINFKTMNKLVKGNQPNHNAGIKENLNAGKVRKETISAQQYLLILLWSTGSQDPHNTVADVAVDVKETENEVHVSPKFSVNSTNRVNAASAPVTTVRPNPTNSTNNFNAASPSDNVVNPNFKIGGKSLFVDPSQYPNDLDMLALEDILYSDDEEDVGFKDHDYPDKVYKVVKALYGLHQAPRAWYETLANYLLENAFEKVIKDKFQMSSMGELTFFLGLQVKQKDDGKFISQDKYVAKILRKFGITYVKSARTSIEIKKPLLKDLDGEDVDIHIYRSMIGSLMYLTLSRPDIMFVVCACARFQVTPKLSHLHADILIVTMPELALIRSPQQEFTMSNPHQELISPEQTVSAKDKSNPLMANNLPKIIWYSAHHVAIIKSWLVQKQTALGKDISNPFMAGSFPKTKWHFITAISYKLMLFGLTKDAAIKLMLLDHKKTVVVTEDVIPQDLRLDDADGVECLPTEEIFAELALPRGLPRTNSVVSWPRLSSALPRVESLIFLKQDKIAQALEILKLKRRVKILKKQRRSKSLGLKRGKIAKIDADEDITLVDRKTEVDLGAEHQGRKDDNAADKEVNVVETTVFNDEEVTMPMDQTLIKMKAEKARLLDEQMAKRLHDEEVEQAAAGEKQEKEDLEKAKVLQKQYEDKQENIDWNTVAEQMQEKHLVEVSGSHSTQDTSTHDPKEMSKEDVKNMLKIIPVTEFKVESLQVKEDLDALWILDKERFSTALPIVDKEKALWVKLKRLFEPDADDVIWKLQRYMHYPIMWKLHSNCGVHQVSSTTRRRDMYMLTENDYPLSSGIMTLMLSTRLQVEEDSEMARDLVTKIFMKANQPKSKSLDTSSK